MTRAEILDRFERDARHARAVAKHGDPERATRLLDAARRRRDEQLERVERIEREQADADYFEAVADGASEATLERIEQQGGPR